MHYNKGEKFEKHYFYLMIGPLTHFEVLFIFLIDYKAILSKYDRERLEHLCAPSQVYSLLVYQSQYYQN